MPIPIVAGVVAIIAGAFASACTREKEEFVTNEKDEKCVPNQTVDANPLCYSQGEYEKLTALKSNIGRKEASIFDWFSDKSDLKDSNDRYEILRNMAHDERAQRFPGMQKALMTIVKNKDEHINLRSYAAHALWPMPLPSTTSDPDVIRAMSYGIRFDL